MKRVFFKYGIFLCVCIGIILYLTVPQFTVEKIKKDDTVKTLEKSNNVVTSEVSQDRQTVILAGGCFWCVEHDLEQATGTISVISGYMSEVGEGTITNTVHPPTYEDYAERGFREVVEVTYDRNKTSFEKLAFHMIAHSDGTDGGGSFHDRGAQYTPAIYYANGEEKKIALFLISRMNTAHIYEKPLAVAVVARAQFYKAEEYHQDYATKNILKYGYYRNASGRDAFIRKYIDKLNIFAKTLDK